METLRVVVEVGGTRTFAAALNWPGWCRAVKGGSKPGRDAARGDVALARDLAVATMLGYRDRYAAVLAAAPTPAPAPAPAPAMLGSPPKAAAVTVVQLLTGDATTDFGAPSAIADDDRRPVTPEEAARLAAILEACWAAFDAARGRSPEELVKGPRGGGRDTSAIGAHVVESERAYARQIGVRVRPVDPDDPAALAAMRAEVLAAVSSGADPHHDAATATTNRSSAAWPLRYAVRRIAWHVLDHTWEIEDRKP